MEARATPQPISAAELDALAEGQLVEIPHWRAGEKMWVRIRYVDLTPKIAAAVGQGSLPNPLRAAVDEAFGETPPTPDAPQGQQTEQHMVALLDEIAREVLVEPSFASLEERGLPLTFGQKLALFEVVMGELKGLEGFRELTADARPADHGQDAPLPT